MTRICAHCGRTCEDYAGGSAVVNGRPVCHPNEPNRPDCYQLLTVYGAQMGALVPCAACGHPHQAHADPDACFALTDGDSCGCEGFASVELIS